MATVKHMVDLVAKVARINKDRAIANDLTELLRVMKGLDNDINNLMQARLSLTLENERLRREVLLLKKSPRVESASPAEPKPQSAQTRGAVDFVWQPDEKKS